MNSGPWQILSILMRDPHCRGNHLALYLALCDLWEKQGAKNPVRISRGAVMHLAKIKSYDTYHKYMGQLQKMDYIIYIPSYHPGMQTLVFFKMH